MTRRDGRLRENQELFRVGNERIGEVARDAGSDDGSIPFLCECAAGERVLEDSGRFQIVRKEES